MTKAENSFTLRSNWIPKILSSLRTYTLFERGKNHCTLFSYEKDTILLLKERGGQLYYIQIRESLLLVSQSWVMQGKTGHAFKSLCYPMQHKNARVHIHLAIPTIRTWFIRTASLEGYYEYCFATYRTSFALFKYIMPSASIGESSLHKRRWLLDSQPNSPKPVRWKTRSSQINTQPYNHPRAIGSSNPLQLSVNTTATNNLHAPTLETCVYNNEISVQYFQSPA